MSEARTAAEDGTVLDVVFCPLCRGGVPVNVLRGSVQAQHYCAPCGIVFRLPARAVKDRMTARAGGQGA